VDLKVPEDLQAPMGQQASREQLEELDSKGSKDRAVSEASPAQWDRQDNQDHWVLEEAMVLLALLDNQVWKSQVGARQLVQVCLFCNKKVKKRAKVIFAGQFASNDHQNVVYVGWCVNIQTYYYYLLLCQT